jgi:uncharacterized protein (TIGR00255 family)
MLKSMTGFGRATTETTTINIVAEVKTLNSKQLDVYCRVPRSYSLHEIEVRNLISQQFERGKIEMILTVSPVGEAAAGTVVNRPLVQAYFKDLQQTAQSLGFEPDPTDLLRSALLMPNAYQNDSASDKQDTENWADIMAIVREAIADCDAFRLREGKVLETIFMDSITKIGILLDEVIVLDVARIPNVRERLRKNVQELVTDEAFDPNRFEQELIYYVEKYDISEEKVRLRTHLGYFAETLKSKDSNGKKLNFVAQEIGREINTIGSKANDAAIQHLVVQMKDELEKIKEQTANVV